MRVTAAQVYRSQLQRTQRKSHEAFEANEKAVSGRRILRPSDDPIGAARSVRVREMRGDLSMARGKIDTIERELGHQEQAIDSMTTLISRARELAVQMANPTADAGDRSAAAVEVAELRSGLLALANSRLGDKRLFAGSQTGSDAFDAAGNYLGDSATVSVRAHLTSSVQVTLAGDALLRGASGGPDIVAALGDLETALTSGSISGVQGALGDLATSTDWMIQQRALVGARMQLVDKLDTHLENLDLNLIDQQSAIEDVDVVQAFSEVVRTKQAFEAAMQVTAAARIQNVFEMLGV